MNFVADSRDGEKNAPPAAGEMPRFGAGWNEEEHDGRFPFHWARRQAELFLPTDALRRNAYLSIWVLGSFADFSQILSFRLDGRMLEETVLAGEWTEYDIPLNPAGESGDHFGDGRLEILLNKVLPEDLHSGDGRELAARIGPIVFHNDEARHGQAGLLHGRGWYEQEADREFPFRWMAGRAELLLPAERLRRRTFLSVWIYSESADSSQTMSFRLGGRALAEIPLIARWKNYSVDLGEPAAPTDDYRSRELVLALNKVLPASDHPIDGRDLGVRVGPISFHDEARDEERRFFHRREAFPPAGGGSGEILCGDGWYGLEDDVLFSYRWMARRAVLLLPGSPLGRNPYLSLWLHSPFDDFSQTLTFRLNGRVIEETPLFGRWAHYSLDLRSRGEDSGPGALELSVNKLFPARHHPGDRRELGLSVGPVAFHDDEARHRDLRQILDNARLNDREMREGRTTLASHPLRLGVDLYGRCNIKPPCVYCLWDQAKAMEGPTASITVDDRTLQSYGPFFQSAHYIVNCSIGEPLLNPRFPEILELCERQGKILEIATNGQSFTPRLFRALAGKPILLYISLDAATKETYAKIRNDAWDEIIPNLVLLNEERKKTGGYPKIFMVFMPMRVNRGDLEAYFQLCRRIEADSLVLRPLFKVDDPPADIERGGYRFNYQNEMLDRDELEDVFRDCERLSAKYGILVNNIFKFGIQGLPGLK